MTRVVDTYAQTRPSLVRLGSLLTGSRAVAEDIADDLIERTFQRDDLIDASRYLHTAMVNACRTHIRRERRRRELDIKLRAGAINENELATLVVFRDALLRLSYAQRTAVILRYQMGYRDHEIANVLGCRNATARSHIKRALTRLKKEMTYED